MNRKHDEHINIKILKKKTMKIKFVHKKNLSCLLIFKIFPSLDGAADHK